MKEGFKIEVSEISPDGRVSIQVSVPVSYIEMTFNVSYDDTLKKSGFKKWG